MLELGQRTAVITYLRDVRDPDALAAALAGLPDVHLFEQRSFLNDIYARFRDHTLRQIALGSAAVMLLLILRYRDWRRATAAFLPSLLVPIIVLSGLRAGGRRDEPAPRGESPDRDGHGRRLRDLHRRQRGGRQRAPRDPGLVPALLPHHDPVVRRARALDASRRCARSARRRAPASRSRSCSRRCRSCCSGSARRRRRVRELGRLALALALLAAACKTLPPPPLPIPGLPRLADCPGRLRSTQEIEGDWVIHERLRVTRRRGRRVVRARDPEDRPEARAARPDAVRREGVLGGADRHADLERVVPRPCDRGAARERAPRPAPRAVPHRRRPGARAARGVARRRGSGARDGEGVRLRGGARAGQRNPVK